MKPSGVTALGGATAAFIFGAGAAFVPVVHAENNDAAVHLSIPDTADPDELSPELATALSKVLAVAGEEAGLGGEWFDRDNKTYTAYLVGPPSDRLKGVAEEVENSLRVKFGEAAATKTQFDLVIEELASVDQVVGVFHKPDGSGLRVEVTDKVTPSLKRQTRTVDASVPVEWDVLADVPYETADTRPDDFAPFNGGSRVTVEGGGGCTMGLPVRRKSNNNVGLLTAAHCTGGSWGLANKAIRTYHGSRLVATTKNHKSLKWDAQFARADTTYGTNIFVGGHLSGDKRQFAPEYRRYVPGDKLRISGGFSGMGFGEVTGMYTPVSGPGAGTAALYQVDSVDNIPMGGNGDSGAAVFEQYQGTAVAAGLYTLMSVASAHLQPCTGVPTGGTRVCSTRAFISPWCDIKKVLNLDVHASGSFFYPVTPGHVRC